MRSERSRIRAALTNPRLLVSLLRRTTSAAVAALMPERCAFCGLIADGDERAICTGCSAELPWIRRPCYRCGMPVPGQLSATIMCGHCQVSPAPFETVIAPLEYTFPVDAAIRAFKFRRKLYYAAAFDEILASVHSRIPADVDAVLPVPLHRWRQAHRGFNQAHELARPIARRLSLPMLGNVSRQRATPPQAGLPASTRARNLDGAFRVRRPTRRRHVLIVDDVVTTGATCRQLATALRRDGVSRVSVIAVARALGTTD